MACVWKLCYTLYVLYKEGDLLCKLAKIFPIYNLNENPNKKKRTKMANTQVLYWLRHTIRGKSW